MTGRVSAPKVPNVGGNDRRIPLPSVYDGWEQVLLDIDVEGEPDVVCDARELASLAPAEYDAVYCSHNLEHYYWHEVPQVLAGFRHVLKPGGFVHIRVPDMAEVMRTVARDGLDIGETLYQAPIGPITVRDVIYGYGREIERSGNDFYAHKTGFTPHTLRETLARCGFAHVFLGAALFEVVAFGFVASPSADLRRRLQLPAA